MLQNIMEANPGNRKRGFPFQNEGNFKRLNHNFIPGDGMFGNPSFTAPTPQPMATVAVTPPLPPAAGGPQVLLGAPQQEDHAAATMQQSWPLQAHLPLKSVTSQPQQLPNGQRNAFHLLCCNGGGPQSDMAVDAGQKKQGLHLQCWSCAKSKSIQDIVQCRYCDHAVCLNCMMPCKSCRQAFCTRCIVADFSQRYEEYFCPDCNRESILQRQQVNAHAGHSDMDL
mmetsp:Transcript_22354/g.29003  ORF Transcript_22354/g.29003 Transcript_22354/m.29003 type:complete len:225 (-) Transcript_22354:264-938(-)